MGGVLRLPVNGFELRGRRDRTRARLVPSPAFPMIAQNMLERRW